MFCVEHDTDRYSSKICKIRHNERAKMMATQNELQQTIIVYNKANTERVKAETEKKNKGRNRCN